MSSMKAAKRPCLEDDKVVTHHYSKRTNPLNLKLLVSQTFPKDTLINWIGFRFVCAYSFRLYLYTYSIYIYFYGSESDYCDFWNFPSHRKHFDNNEWETLKTFLRYKLKWVIMKWINRSFLHLNSIVLLPCSRKAYSITNSQIMCKMNWIYHIWLWFVISRVPISVFFFFLLCSDSL